MQLSIIVPTLNEAGQVRHTLEALESLRSDCTEILVVDGGSRDETIALARSLVDRVISAPRGRAVQMNAGAAEAVGECLLFLHADTRLPKDAPQMLAKVFGGGAVWGRFDVRLSGALPVLRVVEALMNWRSRLTGIATGDQAVFVRRDIFLFIGGFPDIPLMEDIALSRRLKKIARPVCLRQHVVTSSRRWEEHGVWRTVFLMWRLRLRYFFGADPVQLARAYYRQE